ncbi:hypothetical protein MHY87_14180 [Microvirga sp. ACRRW]|uniref:hypothetical protein n=1 Tax=Microvirga sp. ACRRW TaxID=2918205 RepID=UPI001EF50784|nr:hypothetical protein [Microvirga sp. ACRRW]MCG7394056.1 hypothetical protein [Microvirga sp. ACRRW]
MSFRLPTPPVPDLARAKGGSVDELVEWLIGYFNTTGARFNYRSGVRSIKTAYKGLHDLKQLLAGCEVEKTKIGRLANTSLVEHVAPLAFGRATQVFDLPARKFPFGRDRFAAYRVPFFFVENGVIKLYYLQPRKGVGLSYGELCMVASIHKSYLIDTEFFGQECDLEVVDASAPLGGKDRVIQKYNLSELDLWEPERISRRLSLIAEALDLVEASGRVEPRRRHTVNPSKDMPLFD